MLSRRLSAAVRALAAAICDAGRGRDDVVFDVAGADDHRWHDSVAERLAQERSFTRAAELRHVTHPAFGRRIRALESWAGTPLIEREAGPVKLTAAGEAFLDTAQQMTRHLAQ